jgi:hypothetical protein
VPKRREPACKPGSVRPLAGPRRPSLYDERYRSPLAAYPGAPGEPGGRAALTPCLALLRTGFAEPRRSPGALVSSYLTVSPLPRPIERAGAVCFLWHCPRVAPPGTFPSVLPCGARTFLGLGVSAGVAAARPTPLPFSQRKPPAARPRSRLAKGAGNRRGGTGATVRRCRAERPRRTTPNRGHPLPPHPRYPGGTGGL